MPDVARGPLLFAGAGTGLLLGLLLGLSASPVVAAVVGGLVTAAAAYWNLTADAGDQAARGVSTARAVAAGVLCIGCIAGLLGGLWLRTRDLFAVTPAHHVARWTAAGYSLPEARALAAFQTTGMTLPGYSAGTAKPNPAQSTALFSGAAEACDRVRPDDYAGLENLRGAFVQAGEGWKSMAESVSGGDPATQLKALEAAWRLVCD
jgi:hypothetical protein